MKNSKQVKKYWRQKKLLIKDKEISEEIYNFDINPSDLLLCLEYALIKIEEMEDKYE